MHQYEVELLRSKGAVLAKSYFTGSAAFNMKFTFICAIALDKEFHCLLVDLTEQYMVFSVPFLPFQVR